MLRNHAHWIQVFGIVLVCAGEICSAAPITNEQQAKSYLQQYGYIDSDNMASLSYNSIETNNESFEDAIKDFQRFIGIPVTGELDEETLNTMSKPRCGERDKAPARHGTRSKRYNLQGSKWGMKDLTYRITKYSKHLERSIVDEQISNAFNLWSEYVDLTFTPKQEGKTIMNIRFEEGDHGDGYPFEGRGGKLAHASYPIYPNRGDIHFDDAEDWTNSPRNGTNLFWVAVHEIGHTLGLNHTDVKFAVMAPVFPGGNRQDFFADDILGIQAIYGEKSRKFRAYLDDEYGRYSLIGSMYINMTGDFYVNQTPKKISEGWPGVPGTTTSMQAFLIKKKKHYFFKGTKYWRYSGQQMDSGYPREISEGFPGMPDNVEWTLFNDEDVIFYKNMYHFFDMSKTPLP